MKQIRLTHHIVEIYNSIEELSIERFHKYNKMLLVDSGIGGTMESVDRHFARIMSLARSNKIDELGKEIDNMRQSVYMVQIGLNPKMLSFAALVKSIDGELVTDISDEGLQRVVDKLQDETIIDIAQHLGDVKKKIDDELSAYFPSFFETANEKEYHELIRQRALNALDRLIDDTVEDKAQSYTDRLLTFSPTRIFSGHNNAEIKHDKNFLQTCQVISQNLHREAKHMTVAEYYSALETLKEQSKEQQKALKKH